MLKEFFGEMTCTPQLRGGGGRVSWARRASRFQLVHEVARKERPPCFSAEVVSEAILTLHSMGIFP